MVSVTIRLAFVVFLIPRFGIIAYLWGVLFSEFILAVLHLITLNRESGISCPFFQFIFVPVCFTTISGVIAQWINHTLQSQFPQLSLWILCLCILVMTGLFCLLTFSTMGIKKFSSQ